MSERKLNDSLGNLSQAVSKLERALTIPKDRELVYEGTTQLFEYTIELTWTTLKRALAYEGLRVTTPRETVREAFRLGWLHDETIWLDMIEHRNITSHEYLATELADENYGNIVTATPTLRNILDFFV